LIIGVTAALTIHTHTHTRNPSIGFGFWVMVGCSFNPYKGIHFLHNTEKRLLDMETGECLRFLAFDLIRFALGCPYRYIPCTVRSQDNKKREFYFFILVIMERYIQSETSPQC